MGQRERDQRYYAKNAEDIKARKRERYHKDEPGDPLGRTEKLKQKRRHREQQRRAKQKREDWMDSHRVPRPTRRVPKPKPFTIQVQGEDREVQMYTAGALAAAVGRSSQTIRLWEKNGTIPATQFRDSRGRRLYTEDMLRMIVHCFEQGSAEGAFSWSDSEIPQRIREFWARMPDGVWVETSRAPWLEEDRDGEAE